MFRQAHNRGFTIVELLVTLVLMGLVASVAAPGVDAWLTSRNKAAIRTSLSSQIALMPLKASRQSSEIVIASADLFELEGADIRITQPIRILKNGFCAGGEIELNFGFSVEKYVVTQPLCEVQRVAG